MDEVSIEKARAKFGDYVNDAQNGTPVLITRYGNAAAMLVPPARLSVTDRWLITAARESAAAPPGEGDPWEQLGRAKHLLNGLADALERLGGHG